MNSDRRKPRRRTTLKGTSLPKEDMQRQTPTMEWAHLPKTPPPVVKGALFPIGRVAATVGAVESMKRIRVGIAALLFRHQSGDWGSMGAADRAENTEAVKRGSRILSCYRKGALDEAIWVITKADPTEPMLLLPAEFAALP